MLRLPYAILPFIRLPEGSWGYPEMIRQNIESFPGPQADIPPFADAPHFVTGYIYPFHYDHPVTGRPSTEKACNLQIIAAKKAASKAKPKKNNKEKQSFFEYNLAVLALFGLSGDKAILVLSGRSLLRTSITVFLHYYHEYSLFYYLFPQVGIVTKSKDSSFYFMKPVR